ncbi:helix-turn-helix domain-containing protein [Aneurinibacillus sp. Ricciae_BoGa-3]|uniref:helix-turn-helix domain-containing protein n=1 Tax=Aneurinibacillus sp. Ricciae_BoGa-3 TaxID=3022697 RepID=UPI00233FAAF0|nr:helix-turn-helix domain-containing protein [Aneurinibacillus sp. Ricciae_BoGa-3]WCK56539.1 helix-turn-helix domain-containing protein [Aneurinibacillus sp. Ricciae_BoGa-3]
MEEKEQDLTVEETAKKIGVSQQVVIEMIYDGRILADHLGNGWRIPAYQFKEERSKQLVKN